jgi:hypothetical protein
MTNDSKTLIEELSEACTRHAQASPPTAPAHHLATILAKWVPRESEAHSLVRAVYAGNEARRAREAAKPPGSANCDGCHLEGHANYREDVEPVFLAGKPVPMLLCSVHQMSYLTQGHPLTDVAGNPVVAITTHHHAGESL